MEEIYPPDFIPIHLEIVKTDELLPLDLYIRVRYEGQVRYVLYKKKGLKLERGDRDKLMENQISTLFIRTEDIEVYQKYIEKELENVDPEIETRRKAILTYERASCMLRDIFENAIYGSKIERMIDLVGGIVDSILADSRIIKSMLSIIGHDYFTYTHSVNVFILVLGTVYHIGYKEPELLKEIGFGALMHDIGKRRIDRRILQKPGPLDPDEWLEIEKHPLYSAEIIQSIGSVSWRSREITLQHHEKVDGSGYPYGLEGHEISKFSKITCIADIFDALTTDRPYKKGVRPFEALNIMLSEMRSKLDMRLMKGFIGFLAKSEKATPIHGGNTGEKNAGGTLGDLQAQRR